MNVDNINKDNKGGRSSVKEQPRWKVKTGVTMLNPGNNLNTTVANKFEPYLDACPELRQRIKTFAGSIYGCQLVFNVEELTVYLNPTPGVNCVKPLSGGGIISGGLSPPLHV